MWVGVIVLCVQLSILVPVGWIDREYKYNLPFTVSITDENIDGLCLSVYSRDEGNCSPSHVGDGN